MLGPSSGAPSGAPSFSDFSLDLAPNTPPARLLENIRINAALELPWVQVSEAHDDHAVLVGGGPSLARSIEDVRLRQQHGQIIFALNGAAAFLRERGIMPDFQVILDPRIENIRFIIDRPARHFLIASQCDPCVVRTLSGADVTLFHPGGFDDIEDYLPPKRDYVLIGGGIVSGLTAMALAHTMGFRFLHLYGYDSSDDEDGRAHAYPQGETAAEAERVEAMCAGRIFKTSAAMSRQAQVFPDVARMLSRLGTTISVHGDGLLPAVAREMAVEPEPDVAIYDLARAPASWDFAVWLAAAEMDRRRRGIETPLRVRFTPGQRGGFRRDDLPLSIEERHRVLNNVVRPLLDLYGAVEDFTAETGRGYDYNLAQIAHAARSGEAVPRVEAPEWARAEMDEWLAARKLTNPIVITLREAQHHPERNSDLAAWAIFANRLEERWRQVVFVRDTARANERLGGFTTCPLASLDVRLRAALYERAHCNLFVANGPMALAYFGTRPFLIFKPLCGDGDYLPATAEWWRDRIGVPVGEQFPWALQTQRIVWADDTVENIDKAWCQLRELIREPSPRLLRRA